MTIRNWGAYADSFRRREMVTLADWLGSGSSGCVSGLPGVGTSNLLGYFSHRLDIINQLLPNSELRSHLVTVDLNNLPDESAATFYRVILRAVHESATQLPTALGDLIEHTYQAHKATTDSFLVQSALWELMQAFREDGWRVAFVFDRFDDFCMTAVPHMSNTLRGLRDKFKDNLIYIMGMGQEAAYLPEPEKLGRLREILDTRVCWVWPMGKDDAWEMMRQETHRTTKPMPEADKQAVFALSGGYPALTKAICHWWLTVPKRPSRKKWGEVLLGMTAVVYRLQKICAALSQEELRTLDELQKLSSKQSSRLQKKYGATLNGLVEKGVCVQNGKGWGIRGELLARYLATQAGRSRGRLWLNQETSEIMQGDELIADLSPLDSDVLTFLLLHPYIRHTKSEIITNCWPDTVYREGVTDDSIYQVVGSLRRKIEPLPAKPVYLVTWRGNPEGGYQLYPEGRPA